MTHRQTEFKTTKRGGNGADLLHAVTHPSYSLLPERGQNVQVNNAPQCENSLNALQCA